MTAMQTAPDPIVQAKAYQQSLLAALGDDDPADVQSHGPADAGALVAEAGPHLRVRPAPREWSVLLCLAHIADAELVMAGRYRWVLAHDRPELIGYDQDLWVDNLHGDDDDPADLLAQFASLRAGNVTLWRGSSAADRARVAIHRERGEETFELMFRMLAGHDRVHLAQARRALEAVRRR
ncbi:MAG: DinB family protein [bacterium]